MMSDLVKWARNRAGKLFDPEHRPETARAIDQRVAAAASRHPDFERVHLTQAEHFFLEDECLQAGITLEEYERRVTEQRGQNEAGLVRLVVNEAEARAQRDKAREEWIDCHRTECAVTQFQTDGRRTLDRGPWCSGRCHRLYERFEQARNYWGQFAQAGAEFKRLHVHPQVEREETEARVTAREARSLANEHAGRVRDAEALMARVTSGDRSWGEHQLRMERAHADRFEKLAQEAEERHRQAVAAREQAEAEAAAELERRVALLGAGANEQAPKRGRGRVA